MQEITRFEAEELVFNYDIVDQSFYQYKKAMHFDFSLSNDQFLIVIYNHDTKEKSYFVMAHKILRTNENAIWTERPRKSRAFRDRIIQMCNKVPT